MELDLNNTEWDCCVVGNGVSALWVAHWLWSSKKSVLWITSEEPYSPARAMLQHGWHWGLSAENSALLTGQLRGFDSGEELPLFEGIYYDARSSKRFRKLGEVKQDWGTHEKEYFESLAETLTATTLFSDLWSWHAKLHAFHDTGVVQGPTQIELFNEPRFVRVQGWPLVELKTSNGIVTSAVLTGMKHSDAVIEIKAGKFYLGDFDEYLPGLIKTESDSQSLANVIKGRAYRAGFGLRLWHKELASAPSQITIIPLVANPSEKGAGAHAVGRFVQTSRGLESLWVGLLTDEEVEDNNEILKKIKQAKRAIDRAIPGFVDSIQREAVTFEPRMRATDLVKNRKHEALGAVVFSDHYGPEAAAESVKRIFSGVVGDHASKKSRRPELTAGL